MGDSLLDLYHEKEKSVYQPLYKAVPSTNSKHGFGIGQDGLIYCGLVLVPVELNNDGLRKEKYYDALADEIDNVGNEASFILPKKGLILDHLYKPRVINVSYDYETGYPDDWDVELIDVTDIAGGDTEEHC